MRAICRIADKIWVRLGGGRHLIGPNKLGMGPHDCAPTSLYQVVPWIPEARIIEAFQHCTDGWPYAGVTNKEFQIVVKYLEIDVRYSSASETIGTLLERCPARCIALVPWHFIAIINGKIIGRDAGMSHSTLVYCYWMFRPPRLLSAANKRRIFDDTI